MILARRAALVYLHAGLFSLGLAVSQPAKTPDEELTIEGAVVMVTLWPVIWGLAIAGALE